MLMALRPVTRSTPSAIRSYRPARFNSAIVTRCRIRCSGSPAFFSSRSQSSAEMSEYVTSRFSAAEYSRATASMSCDWGPVSSYIRRRFGEDGSNDPRDIRRRDRRSLALPERQFDVVPIADARSGEGQEEPFQEDGRPDGDDGQAGRRERLLAEPVLPLLKTRRGVLDSHLGDGHL